MHKNVNIKICVVKKMEWLKVYLYYLFISVTQSAMESYSCIIIVQNFKGVTQDLLIPVHIEFID